MWHSVLFESAFQWGCKGKHEGQDKEDAGEWCEDITEYRIGKKHVEEMVAISNKNQY